MPKNHQTARTHTWLFVRFFGSQNSKTEKTLARIERKTRKQVVPDHCPSMRLEEEGVEEEEEGEEEEEEKEEEEGEEEEEEQKEEKEKKDGEEK